MVRMISMSEMLLLGAGASVDAGLPTSIDMTRKIVDLFWEDRFWRPEHARVVSFVIGGLLFSRGVKGMKPLSGGVNVEEFFSSVELLAQRNSSEIAPFVGLACSPKPDPCVMRVYPC